jgi:hypothetical protein
VCEEILAAYKDQPQGEYWDSAKSSQALAWCLLGKERHNKELLESSLKACEEASNKLGRGTVEWDLNEKIWGDAYYELGLLNPDNRSAYWRQAQSKYANASSLCKDNYIIFQTVCSELRQRLNDVSRRQ